MNVVALDKDSTTINHFITARHGYQDLDLYFQNYEETLLDGLFVMHNPHALYPISMLSFQLPAKGPRTDLRQGSSRSFSPNRKCSGGSVKTSSSFSRKPIGKSRVLMAQRSFWE